MGSFFLRGLGLIRVRLLLALTGAALAVGGCGGGSRAIQTFVPERVIVFGDETSLLLPDGRRYGVNGLDANSVFDCRLQALWTQILIGLWGYAFAECNPNALPVKAFQRAALGAKVADLVAQIDTEAATGTLVAKDLVTVLVGTHDIVDLYQQYLSRVGAGEDPTLVANELAADKTGVAAVRGATVAQQVNRLIGLGPKVIVSTIPPVQLTPFGVAENAIDPARGALLKRLSDSFNARIRVDILQDGRYVGLVLGDDAAQGLVNGTAVNGVTNVTQAACTVALPDCTTATLVTNATTTNHLWADDLRPAPVLQTSLGNQAGTRARNNPF